MGRICWSLQIQPYFCLTRLWIIQISMLINSFIHFFLTHPILYTILSMLIDIRINKHLMWFNITDILLQHRPNDHELSLTWNHEGRIYCRTVVFGISLCRNLILIKPCIKQYHRSHWDRQQPATLHSSHGHQQPTLLFMLKFPANYKHVYWLCPAPKLVEQTKHTFSNREKVSCWCQFKGQISN